MTRRAYQAALVCPGCQAREPIDAALAVRIVEDGLRTVRRRWHDPQTAACPACRYEYVAASNLEFARQRPHKVRRGAVLTPA